jgi:hypothetical protein
VALLKFGVDYETLVENTEIRYAFKYFRLNGFPVLSHPVQLRIDEHSLPALHDKSNAADNRHMS